MIRTIARVVMITALLALAFGAPAFALDKFEAEVKVDEAATVVKTFMTAEDKGAPQWLLKKARAVVIAPNMVKAGFVVGGTYGRGMILVKKADGSWSPPSFIRLIGGDVGFQIGAQSVDLLLVAMSERGLQGILKNQVKFGADASVAAGPVGRTTSASVTGASFKADVYSYSRSAGAFAGATIGGSSMEADKDTDKAYYGKALTPRQILLEGKAVPPKSAKRLMETLARFSK